ncbi:hypothetical protein [Crossiella cryophila]|uniref:Uncharacterized protein n=1 Tax=Crossiella cryophila TaxID=43355 RepID=A0A7W7CIA4_9PSEU|nr:hypothetical protein [Crossiella cryophila]MBB4681792.1 hypothetical protein [Crossiella cryophila]
MATPVPFCGELDPDSAFELHLRFRVPLWRLESGTRRIQAALTQLKLSSPPVEVVLADDVLVTVSIPAGTLGDAIHGQDTTVAGIRHARRLAELLWDLDPVLVNSPQERT